uniref:Cytochrome P450 4B1-like n=1 Tax=Nothoprocta perdicaria TaxID=30464 RepID=A0A8C7A121_NOTPE
CALCVLSPAKQVKKLDTLSLVLGFIFVLLKAAQFYQKRKKVLKALEAFPGPPKHWLYGHSHQLSQRKLLAQFMEWAEEFPYAFPRWLGPLPTLIIHHPEYAKTICGRGGKSSYLLIVSLLFASQGEGLLVTSGAKWFQHRKLLTPAFHYDVLKPYMRLMSDSVKVMLDKWEKNKERKPVELFHDVSLMTLDTIMKCAFSYNTSCQTQKSVAKLLNSKKTKGTGEDPEKETPGFSGHSTLWGMWAPVPIAAAQTQPSLWLAFREDLGKMTFCTMCIKESLRLFPPVPIVSRYLSKPVTFSDGRSLPEGLFALSIRLVHLIFPQMFDPMRFAPQNAAQRHSHAFLPFSAGPRNCIGQQFAMNEMKVALALTLKHFELTPDASRPPILIPQLVLKSANGIHMHLKKIC